MAIANPTVTITIATSTTISSAIELNGVTLVGFYMPSAFTGTAITFQACDTSDGTFLAITTISAALSATVAASKYVAVDPVNFYGVKFLKLVSGTAEIADRTIKLCTREIR